MLFAILNAGFIYGVIWIFERKRRELYEFDFGKIAVIPPSGGRKSTDYCGGRRKP
jgi:hypothetical protein